MIIGLLILFAFICVHVPAFSSNNRETVVRRIDPETKKETTKFHETIGASPGTGF